MTIQLNQTLVIELVGVDAGKVLHNLTTNQVQQLQVGASLETFVTDVRGWTVAHGIVFRAQPDRWLLVGQHPDPALVCSHIDRYIIREKAVVNNLSPLVTVDLCIRTPASEMGTSSAVEIAQPQTNESFEVEFSAIGPHATLRVEIGQSTSGHKPTTGPSTAWEQIRIAHFWPLMGVDIWEKCIPQEIDRDEQAISFTKGCYLGQETIARLDARGQIQKKLCLLRIDGVVSSGDKLLLNDLEVGYITSTAPIRDFSIALSVVRRGHFALDTRLTCLGQASQIIDATAAAGLMDCG